ncbi:MAG: HesA/MoeB/ThiF family protein [Bacteroidales bacterium]|nr:HesA/MoeB/ThiF family protein [Bacteroidales bacterium]MCB9000119.1 HesA/MoeB/ThiF family protein [Bacteroidales bacterium]MCB9014127.1 HesA/MoeB/ThiF family protein [Bacteroidales bacterium]
MLSDAEKRRYHRHIILPGIGEEGQEKLKSAKVLVVGAGGIGAPVLQYLTAAGVGNIAIMDDEIVNEENLHRQILYGGHDLGKLKTIISKQRLNSLNPLIKHEIFNIRLSAANALEFISNYDIIVDTTDNASTPYLINDACIISGKPWVYASLDKFEGQISTFNCQGSPSLRCAYPLPREITSTPGSKKGLFGVLPGIIGSMQAVEVLKILTGIGKPLCGKILVYNMLTQLIKTIEFEKNPENFSITRLRPGY